MSLLLGLAPSLLDWLPHLLGGLAGATGLLGLVPSLRPVLTWAPWVLVAICIGGLLWYRGEYRGEVAARAADQAAATAKVLEVQREAQRQSDLLVIDQAIALGNSARKRDSYVEQIHRLLMPIACASALAACTTSSRVVAVDRQPSAALLLPCQDPELVPDPETATPSRRRGRAHQRGARLCRLPAAARRPGDVRQGGRPRLSPPAESRLVQGSETNPAPATAAAMALRTVSRATAGRRGPTRSATGGRR
jgi:hypothetical protein